MDTEVVPVSLRWARNNAPHWLGPRIKQFLGVSGPEQPKRNTEMSVISEQMETRWSFQPNVEGLAAVAMALEVVIDELPLGGVRAWSVGYETMLGLDPITDEPLARMMELGDTPCAVGVFGGAVIGWQPVVVSTHPAGWRAWCAHHTLWTPADGELTLGGPLGVMAPALTASHRMMKDQPR